MKNKIENFSFIVFLLLALFGAIISAPHTLSVVLPVYSELARHWQLIIGGAVFGGVELGVLTTAFMNEWENPETKKRFSLAGLLNNVLLFVGFRPMINLDHIPERKPSKALMWFLFTSALIFNLLDTLQDTPFWTLNSDILVMFVSIMTGIIGPILLFIAGDKFAREVVRQMKSVKAQAVNPSVKVQSVKSESVKGVKPDGVKPQLQIVKPASDRAERLQALYKLLKSDPNVAKSEMAETLQVSRPTLYSDLDELARAGIIVADGSYKSGYRANGKA